MQTKVTGLIKRGETWHYDFKLRGHRFCGSTRLNDRSQAERWIEDFKNKRLDDIKQLNGEQLMSFGALATRWWQDKAQHRKDNKDIIRTLKRFEEDIGSKRIVTTIDNNLITQLISKRRATGISNGTINRTVTEPLRAIIKYAEFIGQPVKRISWRDLILPEPAERVREMGPEEEIALFENLRPDYFPIVKFLLATGIRRAEACKLEWKDVDLNSATITVRGKGGTVDRRPLSNTALAILQSEKGNHPIRVFTYVVKSRSWAGQAKGSRKPIAPDTLSTAYWRARKAAGLEDLRLHDLRHTTASRVVRATGNIMAASKVLGHKRVTTTQRYAHLAAEDVRAALNAAEQSHAKLTQTQKIKVIEN